MLDEVLQLLDWKRHVFAAYGEARTASDPAAAWMKWRAVRDRLFATHPQSPLPLEDREAFTGLDYYDYDPRARVLATAVSAEPVHREIATSGTKSSTYGFTRFAVARFVLFGESMGLELHWLDDYAGGLFVSFGDATNGVDTYGGGRYLLDTVKGADLGAKDGKLVLDFNFAYNPSCAYNPQWVCPLVPHENRLSAPIKAGERACSRRSARPE